MGAVRSIEYPDRDGLWHPWTRFGVVLGLLFLAGPIVDLAHQSGVPVGLRAVGLSLFVLLYVSLLPPAAWLIHSGRRALAAGIAGLVAIATILLATGAPGSFVALYVYAVAAAGLICRPRVAVGITVLVALGVTAGLAVYGTDASAGAAVVLTIVAIGAMMAGFGRQVRTNHQLVAAREELARLAVSQERLRIARDLHDLLGHTLSVIALKTELAAKLVERDSARAVAELEDVQTVTRQALAEVREAVHSYRQLALDEALAGARAQLEAAGIESHLERQRVSLPDEAESVLAWAVREGVTNVVRHSHARHCAIRLRSNGETAAVEIEDDGSGLDDSDGGRGLEGLTERAERLRGTVAAGALPGGGFRLLVSVPLAAP
jgi:two-component system, NarL family, sensor histidine kinase DesK